MKGVITIQFESMEELKEILSLSKKTGCTVAEGKTALNAPEITKEEQIITDKTIKKAKPVEKEIDTGKIGALYKAGWNTADIAGEMRLSLETVRACLRAQGFKLKPGKRGQNDKED